MVLDRIRALLESCSTESPHFPPTLLYNEGWLLRLILDWFSSHSIPSHSLNFQENASWFSEALLPSTFLVRYRGDPLAENWTHADGVVGHFSVGTHGKTDLSLLKDATQFIVLETKMLSGFGGTPRSQDICKFNQNSGRSLQSSTSAQPISITITP